MAKAYLVSHTHWDREWYFTACDALMLSDQLFVEVLEELENNPKANFCMDGQSSVVDDFLEIHPELLDTVKKFVNEGRLFIGPWYAQTDALYVDGESILRNLMIGIRDTRMKYGSPMMVGYLPDTFGFTPSLPAIFHHVGIDSLLHWRGTNFDLLAPSPYYLWQGASNNELIGVNFPHGYMSALITNEALQEIDNYVEKRYDPTVDFLVKHGDNDIVLMPSGIDQKNIVRNIDEVVNELNKESKHETFVSTYPEFVELLRKNIEKLPFYRGELRLPSYSRVHRTIGSVRMDFKIMNFKYEQALLRKIEPMMIIAKECGIVIGQELLAKVWKKLFECQAHDSLGGCVSDNVAEDIFHRYKEIDELISGIENTISRKIADSLNLKENEIIVFNTDPQPYKGFKEIHVVSSTKNIEILDVKKATIIDEKYYPLRHDIVKQIPTGVQMIDEPAYYELWVKAYIELPALGYKILSYKEVSEPLSEPQKEDSKSIKNSKYQISFENGSLNIKTKFKEIHNFIELVDASNMGDTYDYSPMEDEQEAVLPFNECNVLVSQGSKCLIVSGSANLPKTLEDRESETPNLLEVPYSLKITMDEEDDLIQCDLSIKNTVESHRMRVKLNTEIYGNESYSQIQNAFVKNTNILINDNWKENFVEKPVNINFLDKSVSVEGTNHTINLYSYGLREYEKDSKYLYLTLMATTGELGKADLAWRPGRASGDTTNQGHVMMPTPLAQLMGENEFKFAIEVVGEYDELQISKNTYNWLHQSISYQKQTLNMFINRLDNKIWPLENSPKIQRELSFNDFSNKLIISSIYPSYLDSKNYYIVRVVNPTSKTMEIDNDKFKSAISINALEEEIDKTMVVEPYDMLTFKFKY